MIYSWYQKDGGGKVWPAEKSSHFDAEKKSLRVEIWENSFLTKIDDLYLQQQL